MTTEQQTESAQENASQGGGRRRRQQEASESNGSNGAHLPPPTFKIRFRDEIVPAMVSEFGYSSPMQVPRLSKINLNIGLGEALTNGRAMESAVRDLTTISGQKPVITRARRSVSISSASMSAMNSTGER